MDALDEQQRAEGWTSAVSASRSTRMEPASEPHRVEHGESAAEAEFEGAGPDRRI